MPQDNKQPFAPTADGKLTPKELRKVRRQGVKARRRRKRVICFLLVVVIMAVSIMPLYRHVFQPWQANTLYKTTRNLYGQNGTGALGKEYNEYFGALYDMNPDVAGWLIVSGEDTSENGIDLNLPVVQPKAHDSAFYQTHLFNGVTNPYGTPYFMTECKPQEKAYNTVICSSQSLMGALAQYRNLDFYKNAPTFFLDTLTDTAFYKIVAVVDVLNAQLSQFTTGAFATEYDFYRFVTDMGERSVLYTGVTVNRDDSLVTLLCENGADYVAVIARRAREEESPKVDTSVAFTKAVGTAESFTDWVASPTEVTMTDVLPIVDTVTEIPETVTQPEEDVTVQVWEETKTDKDDTTQ